jgi:hypothetical protein
MEFVIFAGVWLVIAHVLEAIYRMIGRSIPLPKLQPLPLIARRVIRGTIQCAFLIGLGMFVTYPFGERLHEQSEARAAEPMGESKFAFEQIAIGKHYLQGYVINFVVRNNTTESFKLIHIGCAAYANGKLVDTMVALVSYVEPMGRQNGQAYSGDGKTRPDGAECGATVLYKN